MTEEKEEKSGIEKVVDEATNEVVNTVKQAQQIVEDVSKSVKDNSHGGLFIAALAYFAHKKELFKNKE